MEKVEHKWDEMQACLRMPRLKRRQVRSQLSSLTKDGPENNRLVREAAAKQSFFWAEKLLVTGQNPWKFVAPDSGQTTVSLAVKGFDRK